MHERSLVRALLHQVDQLMRANSADRVVGIRVSIGDFSGVEPELLCSAFEEMASSTPAAGAELTVQRVPLECRCRVCGAETLVQRFRFVCSQCQGRQVDIVRGEQLTLESVTLAGDQ